MLHAKPAPPFGFSDFPAGLRGNDYIAGMVKLVLMAAMLSGCATYFGDGDVGPDAAVAATPDAKECGFTLPRCGERDTACATGQTPIDCPHDEDPSVCYCPSPTNPGWCVNQ